MSQAGEDARAYARATAVTDDPLDCREHLARARCAPVSSD